MEPTLEQKATEEEAPKSEESTKDPFYILMDDLRTRFEKLNRYGRHKLISLVGDAVQKIHHNSYGQYLSKSKYSAAVFSADKAKQVRVQTGLSVPKLAAKLLPDNEAIFAQYIRRIEAGLSTPRNPPAGRWPSAYIEWLRKNGYDPYNLGDSTNDKSPTLK